MHNLPAAALCLLLAAGAGGETVWFDASAAPGGDGTESAPWNDALRVSELSSGDEAVFKDGTYHLYEAMTLLASNCVLRSESGNPAGCVLQAHATDNNNAGRYHVLDVCGESNLLCGVTLAGGTCGHGNSSDFDGAAFDAYGRYNALSNCVVRDCFGRGNYQGIGAAVSGPRDGNSGNSLYAFAYDCVVSNCTANNGSVALNRVAVYRTRIRNCVQNNASGSVCAPTRMEDCIVEDCTTAGGCIVQLAPGAWINRCIVRNNAATSPSRGILQASTYQQARAYNCLVYGNEAKYAMASNGGTIYVYNGTFADNVCEATTDKGTETHLHNSVVWGNRTAAGGVTENAFSSETIAYQSVYKVDFNCIEGGEALAGPGNIAVDPKLSGRFVPEPDSPCIDAGDPATASAYPELGALDVAGNPRFFSLGSAHLQRADMGAVEWQGPVATVLLFR